MAIVYYTRGEVERGRALATEALVAAEARGAVYGWFTEGFDTRDLIEAKALLEELGG